MKRSGGRRKLLHTDIENLEKLIVEIKCIVDKRYVRVEQRGFCTLLLARPGNENDT